MFRGLFVRLEPGVRRTVAIDVAATALVAACNGIVNPFAGLILRREFDATPLQLSIGASASAVSLLLSLAWARLAAHHPPLWWVVWPGVVARGLFVLTPIASSAWTLMLVCAVSGFVVTMTGPALALLDLVGSRGAAVSAVRGVLAPLLGAAVIEWAVVSAVYVIALALMAAGILLLGRIASAPTRDDADEPASAATLVR